MRASAIVISVQMLKIVHQNQRVSRKHFEVAQQRSSSLHMRCVNGHLRAYEAIFRYSSSPAADDSC